MACGRRSWQIVAMIRALFVATSLLVLSACGNPNLIDGKAYKTACTTAADCVGVFFGDQCGACACPNAAISTNEKVAYDADRSAAIATCGPRPAIACAACVEKQPACTAGVCGLP
jgi:hypothetical protein